MRIGHSKAGEELKAERLTIHHNKKTLSQVTISTRLKRIAMISRKNVG